MSAIPRYRVVFDAFKNAGAYEISLVDLPAMEQEFIALSKQNLLQFATIDKEQKLLLGVVLEPDKQIPRRDEKRGDFTVEFDKETVKELSHSFFKNGHQKNSSIEHDTKNPIEGVTIVESWLVQDPKNDKSNLYGIECNVGTWVATMKVDNDAIWNNYVKEGKVKGFSISAFTQLEEIKLNKLIDIKMSETKKTAVQKLKDGFNELLELFKTEADPQADPVLTSLGSIKLEDGTVTLEYEGEMLKVGDAVFVTMEDGTKVGAPVGEHLLESGITLVVKEEGIVAELREAKPEPSAEPEQVKEELTAEPAGMTPEKALQGIKKVIMQFSQDLEEQEAKEQEAKVELSKQTEDKLTALKTQLDEVQTQLSTYLETPAVEPLKAEPRQGSVQAEIDQMLAGRKN